MFYQFRGGNSQTKKLTFAVSDVVKKSIDPFRAFNVVSHRPDSRAGVGFHDGLNRFNEEGVSPTFSRENHLQHVVSVQCCEAFVEPKVRPPGRADEVSEPLMLKVSENMMSYD
jgi:hypothetical protein